jgi:hypothetical protein
LSGKSGRYLGICVFTPDRAHPGSPSEAAAMATPGQ